ncbi:MAG: universal stress protein [Muricauda sp.]|nr:universal stress protein [Allomuricauda sp.]MBA4743999.1 universal stress protein [Allomuricauda sp.]
MEGNQKKYRISVLLDMSKNSSFVLNSAVELAKRVEGSIEVFHVKPTTNIIKGDSQLSAIRTLNQDDRSTRAEINELISKINEKENLSIGYKLEYGNVKNRVRDYLALQNPDILVLGKRRPRLGIFSESITDFVINQTNNTNVLILGEDDKFHSFEDINLGFFGAELAETNLEVIQDLKRDSKKPVRHFDISNEETSQNRNYPWHKTVSYKFRKGANAYDGLVNYVSRTNTQLLCVSKSGKNFMFKPSPIKSVIRKAKVPLMVLAK